MLLSFSKNIVWMSCLLLFVPINGCATVHYGKQITHVEYYPACYAPLQELRDADKSFNVTVAVSSTAGALVGAALGYLTSGKAGGALAGAASGAALGGGLGYAKAKSDRTADDNQRMAEYLQDIDGDISGLDRATAAARTARNCYNREFSSALMNYRSGRMSKSELQRRYTEINEGCQEVQTILGSMITSSDRKEQQYRSAMTHEASISGMPLSAAVAAGSYRQAYGGVYVPYNPAGNGVYVPYNPEETKQSYNPPAAKSSLSGRTVRRSVQKQKPVNSDRSSLNSMARSTDLLSQSKKDAQDEQEALKKMQDEMNNTLANITA